MKSYLTPSDQDKKPSKKAAAGVDPDTLPQTELIPEAVTAYRALRKERNLKPDALEHAEQVAREQAFQQGRRAHVDGVGLDQCPYRRAERERTHRDDVCLAAWELGWRSVARARNEDPETSKEAARRISHRLTELETLVLSALQEAGHYGATSGEVAEATGVDLQSVTPRFAPMAERGLVVRTKSRRDGRYVWVAAGYERHEDEAA